MTTRTRAALLALMAVAALAGCSDGGGDGTDSPDGGDGTDPLPTYAELDALGEALSDEAIAEVEANGYTDPSTLPTSGAVTYEGVIGLGTDGVGGVPEAMIGEMTLTAEFDDASDPISGTATNFVTDSDEALAGSLILQDSVLDRGADPDLDPTYEAGLTGTLTDGSGLALDVSGDVLGNFSGADADYAAALVAGEIATSAGTAEFLGAYVGER